MVPPLSAEAVDFLQNGPSRRRQDPSGRGYVAPQGERKGSFEINAHTVRTEEASPEEARFFSAVSKDLRGLLEALLAYFTTAS